MKKIFADNDTIILHALDRSSGMCASAAEHLVRNGYAEYIKMESSTVDVEKK